VGNCRGNRSTPVWEIGKSEPRNRTGITATEGTGKHRADLFIALHKDLIWEGSSKVGRLKINFPQLKHLIDPQVTAG